MLGDNRLRENAQYFERSGIGHRWWRAFDAITISRQPSARVCLAIDADIIQNTAAGRVALAHFMHDYWYFSRGKTAIAAAAEMSMLYLPAKMVTARSRRRRVKRCHCRSTAASAMMTTFQQLVMKMHRTDLFSNKCQHFMQWRRRGRATPQRIYVTIWWIKLLRLKFLLIPVTCRYLPAKKRLRERHIFRQKEGDFEIMRALISGHWFDIELFSVADKSRAIFTLRQDFRNYIFLLMSISPYSTLVKRRRCLHEEK